MIQVDILLGGLCVNCDIVVNNIHNYDIILNKKYYSYDVCIDNLTDRQSIYGDELEPLIFHLTQDSIECFVDVNMLAQDEYYNITLLANDIDIRSAIYTKLKRNILKLQTELNASLSKTLKIKHNNLKLSVSGVLTDSVLLKPITTSSQLATQVLSNISKNIELMMNVSGAHWFCDYLYKYDSQLLSDMDVIYPKSSLVTRCGKMYMKCKFDVTPGALGLKSDIDDFTNNITIKDSIRNSLNLNSDIPFDYQIICSCNPFVGSLSQSNISIDTVIFVLPEISITEFGDWIAQDIRETSHLGVIGDVRLKSIMTEDEMIAYYGIGYYDKRYLYQWDSHTLSSMGAEVSTTSRNNSVDM